MMNAQTSPAVAGQVERRVRRPRRLRISFACNDHRNGDFAGRATAANVQSLYCIGRHPWDAELAHDDWGRGCRLTVDDKMMKLRIHGVWFPFKARRSWYGSWCWEAFDFERGTAKRLLMLMRERGAWHCEAGVSVFFRWWKRTPNALGQEPCAAVCARSPAPMG